MNNREKPDRRIVACKAYAIKSLVEAGGSMPYYVLVDYVFKQAWDSMDNWVKKGTMEGDVPWDTDYNIISQALDQLREEGLALRSYEKAGQEPYSTEIVFIDPLNLLKLKSKDKDEKK
jgi:hypothetical protein